MQISMADTTLSIQPICPPWQCAFTLCTIGKMCDDGVYKFLVRHHNNSITLIPASEMFKSTYISSIWAMGPAIENGLAGGVVKSSKTTKTFSVYAAKWHQRGGGTDDANLQINGKNTVIGFAVPGGAVFRIESVYDRNSNAMAPLIINKAATFN